MAWYMPSVENWRFDPVVSGGGILMDGHSHHIAFFNWLLGDPPLHSVYSEIGTLASDARVEDTGVTLLRGDNVIAEISGSMRLREPNPQNGRGFKESIEIFGTNGTIHIHPTERPSLKVFVADEEPAQFGTGGWFAPRLDWVPYEERGFGVHFNSDEDPWVEEHRHFVRCVRDGTPVVSDGRFGRRVLAITLAGYESANQKRAVSLSPFAEESVRAAR